MNRLASTALAAVSAIILCSCGGETTSANHANDPLPNGLTVKQQIEARQSNLKNLGASFKKVNDQLKTDSPQLEEIRAAARTMKGHAEEIANWFPASTGPESGVKTEALATIWSDSDGFYAAAARLRDETGRLSDISMTDNIEAMKTQAQATGGACKNCHDTFRLKKS